MAQVGQRALRWLKRGWLLLVFFAVAWYVYANWDQLTGEITRIDVRRLLLAVAMLIGGKLLLVQHSRFSVMFAMPYPTMFMINSISQLAKYVPGGIWQFVGRAAYYRAGGLSSREIARSMLHENIWLVVSALCAGAVFLALDHANSIALSVILLVWFVSIRLTLGRWSWGLLVLQVVLWLCLGLSYALLLPVDLYEVWWSAGAAFALSWALGYVIIFAPGGIGIREAVLSGLLLAFLPAEQGLLLATLHRFLWLLSEVILALLAVYIHVEIPADQ